MARASDAAVAAGEDRERAAVVAVTTAGRRRVYGVDVSGAQDAGDNVWVASAVREGERLFVEGCFPGSALPDSGRDREACLAALRQFLANADGAVVGLDVPFSLPAELIAADSWTDFLAAFPGGADDPEAWAADCRERADRLDGERVERMRRTEEAVGAGWSPYNLRLRSATFYALRDVLGPLVEADAVSVLPMQPPDPGRPWLLETYPAATFDRLGLASEGYKGDTGSTERRSELLDGLEEAGVTITPAVKSDARADDDGDALDAVVAAVGVARALDEGTPLSPGTVDARARLEGRIYA